MIFHTASSNAPAPFGTRLFLIALLGCALALPLYAHNPEFTDTFGRERCDFTSAGRNPYFILEPGYALTYEGEEDGAAIGLVLTVLDQIETVDGVETRVVEERETEDGELIEVSRNFFAICRQNNTVFYFGEDVDIFEDGEIVSHEGAWRAGADGAQPGIVMPGMPLAGARYFLEQAPIVALDLAEIESVDDAALVPAGFFENVLRVVETSLLDPEEESVKLFAPGVGLIVDDELELVEITDPPCPSDPGSLCLNHGRFQVEVEWADFEGNEGTGTAIPLTADSGLFWFFGPDNVELTVKVLDACNLDPFNSFWVFASGLTNVEVTLTVTDTRSNATRVYENPLGTDFAPILDSSAFLTCP